MPGVCLCHKDIGRFPSSAKAQKSEIFGLCNVVQYVVKYFFAVFEAVSRFYVFSSVRILICVNGVLKHVNTPDSYLRERCANIVDSVRSLA